ncbi:MAG: histidine--tRNA ligase [Gammaproteobacteria bacterium]|nr:MAG: histidine--tRNA ligase [Gammaproteobacteria bacterium]
MKAQYKRLRGMPDLLPEDLRLWHRFEAAVRETMHAYGYGEMRTPVLEASEVFVRSIGEATDIVEKEMYTFADRKGAPVSMRPENTAGCVRAAIENGLLQQGATARIWYQGPMFRYERPQLGRQRQFHQVGAEAYGIAGPVIEAELILMCARLWRELGVADALSLEVNTLGTTEERQRYRDELVAYFNDHRDELDEDSLRRLDRNPLRILDSKNPDMQAMLAAAPVFAEYLGVESGEHHSALLDALSANGVEAVPNARLVRGLDYYSHTVFEWTTDRLGAQSAVCGGGRYDGLLAEFGAAGVAGVGWALGVERVIALMQALEIAAPDDAADVFVITAGAVPPSEGLIFAEELRRADAGLSVLHNSAGGSMKSQFRKADRSGARFAAIIGDEEIASGTVSLKPLLSDAAQRQLGRTEVAAAVAAATDAGDGFPSSG